MSSQSSLSSPSSTKSSSPISAFLTNSSEIKENNFKKSMNALKENYLRSKITKGKQSKKEKKPCRLQAISLLIYIYFNLITFNSSFLIC